MSTAFLHGHILTRLLRLSFARGRLYIRTTDRRHCRVGLPRFRQFSSRTSRRDTYHSNRSSSLAEKAWSTLVTTLPSPRVPSIQSSNMISRLLGPTSHPVLPFPTFTQDLHWSHTNTDLSLRTASISCSRAGHEHRAEGRPTLTLSSRQLLGYVPSLRNRSVASLA
ncbi:hypothetical protein BDW22DRAFT_227086 [Trametopsis cervina]|nr:hypothetical protein BDW22DRAFT_227086 [Trametopsis cervina]